MYWGFSLACCLLGGCTTMALGPRRVASVQTEQPLPPLDYYAWVESAPESALKVELFGLEINAGNSDPIVTAVRTGMILSTPVLATTKTELQALSLVNEVASLEAKDEVSKAYKVFAEVLQLLLQQREHLRAADTANQRGLVEIDSLKQRNRQLQQQIEELTSIEQQIIERERQNRLEP